MNGWPKPEDWTGVLLGERYRIVRMMGEGGMGAVYEATHVKLEGKVAVKMLHPFLASDERHRKRFLREARAAYRIQSEHVVDILDFGEEPTAYFVMEYLEGMDLAKFVSREGKLSWARVQAIALQAMSALAAAHRLGIVHRDIKPSNIFLVPRDDRLEHVKVLDFGIAKVADSGPETIGITRTHEVLGTVLYMAPEQATAGAVDARSDVYSFGVVLYQLLTGTAPFIGTNQYQIIDQHVRKSPPLLSTQVRDLPPGVEELVLRAMAKHPDERFQSMEEMAEATRAITAVPKPGPHGWAGSANLPQYPPSAASYPGAAVPITGPTIGYDGTPGHPQVVPTLHSGSLPGQVSGATDPGRVENPSFVLRPRRRIRPALVGAGLAVAAILSGGAWVMASAQQRSDAAEPAMLKPAMLEPAMLEPAMLEPAMASAPRTSSGTPDTPKEGAALGEGAAALGVGATVETSPAKVGATVEASPVKTGPVTGSAVEASSVTTIVEETTHVAPNEEAAANEGRSRMPPSGPVAGPVAIKRTNNEAQALPPSGSANADLALARLKHALATECSGTDKGATVTVQLEITRDGRAYPDDVTDANAAAMVCIRKVVRAQRFPSGKSRSDIIRIAL